MNTYNNKPKNIYLKLVITIFSYPRRCLCVLTSSKIEGKPPFCENKYLNICLILEKC